MAKSGRSVLQKGSLGGCTVCAGSVGTHAGRHKTVRAIVELLNLVLDNNQPIALPEVYNGSQTRSLTVVIQFLPD